MHRPPVIVRVVVLVVVLSIIGAWWYLGQNQAPAGPLSASGTIEANTVTLSPQLPGRVATVAAAEGDRVTAGQALITLDGATLQAQRDQAQAAIGAADANVSAAQAQIQTAQAGVAAAQARVDLLDATPTANQLAVAQAAVDKARVAVADLEDAYDELSKAAKDTPAGRALKLQRDLARADLVAAQAQQTLVADGPQPAEKAAAQAQLDAANAQVDAATRAADAATAQASAARAALATIDSQIAQLTISSPIDGIVLTRAVEPGEYAAPGAGLMVVGDLTTLTITVYVPEDRLSAVSLGQAARVNIDSSDQTFTGTVSHIAEQAEFTPRNVQTPEGRKSTVFAVKLAVANPDGTLKPGMPADVAF
jgi:HlyD family secretion protein